MYKIKGRMTKDNLQYMIDTISKYFKGNSK